MATSNNTTHRNTPENPNEGVFMSLYIEADLKQAIRMAAAERGMSMSKLVTTMLRQAFLSKATKGKGKR